ncbi:MAG TPA: hypothetical protein VHL59_06595, partial [Thermoanaerobaculia bacterium]|nr:hypothetical protein [Thermoanaerobaculia bacterium]
MKKAASAVVLVLCICATACPSLDTKRGNSRRTIEPRLTGMTRWAPCSAKPLAAGRVVEETDCGVTAPAEAVCEEILDHAQAMRALASGRRCTDHAIDALERFAAADRRIMSDVAAAYYVRAQREDRATDLLRALAAAEAGVEAAPEAAEARFNLALVQEAIGLREDAIQSWSRFLTIERNSDWRKEASRRLRSLQAAQDPGAQWRLH